MPDWVKVVLGIGGVLVVAAALMYTLRAKIAETWREEAEAQKERGDRLEKEVEQLKVTVAEQGTQITALRELATARPEVIALTKAITDLIAQTTAQHNENAVFLSRLEGGISRIETAVISH